MVGPGAGERHCPGHRVRGIVAKDEAGADFESSDDELRAFQHRIFLQDQPVLEAQRPKRLPLTAGEVHCAADRTATAYRRWLHERQIGFGVC